MRGSYSVNRNHEILTPIEEILAKERPILFSTPMVKAILDGSKTQTRRTKGLEALNTNPNDAQFQQIIEYKGNAIAQFRISSINSPYDVKCPYGQVGDRLWVRETWRIIGWWEGNPYRLEYRDGEIMDEPHDSIDYDEDKYSDYAYQCDNDCIKAGVQSREDGCFEFSEGKDIPTRWRPSIHMPRWASRIDIEITEIRVERLQEISEADARAEAPPEYDGWFETWKDCFKVLWDSINGKKYPWDNNPWVWVIGFKVVK